MQDVAREAGVSTATVSRVLAGFKNATSELTAKRVRETAERLGYVVNAVAASLRSQQTSSVGLILADISNPFFGQLAIGLEKTLTTEGYGVILANSSNSVEDEKRLLRLMMEKQVAAIVIASSADSGEHIRDVIGRGMTVVLVDTELDDVEADAVVVDNRRAAKAAVDHLIELGHRSIGVVTGQLHASFDRERLLGYRDAFSAHNLPVPETLILRADSTVEGGARAVRQGLARDVLPTALFATNNLMTTGAIAAVVEHGLSIPFDISVVGFDDMEWYSIFNPQITAVSQPAYDIGRVAAERLLDRLGSKERNSPRRFVLDTRLIVRKSTMEPHQARSRDPNRQEAIASLASATGSPKGRRS